MEVLPPKKAIPNKPFISELDNKETYTSTKQYTS